MTLHALRPDPSTGAVDEDSEVVDESRYGWESLKQAIALWRLVDSARANEIEAIKDRAALRDPDEELRFDAADLRELVRMLAGIEDAIVAAGIVDDQWRVSVDQLAELAKRVPGMDLTSERSPESKRHALSEVMDRAISARTFLAKALEEGCVVALG